MNKLEELIEKTKKLLAGFKENGEYDWEAYKIYTNRAQGDVVGKVLNPFNKENICEVLTNFDENNKMKVKNAVTGEISEIYAGDDFLVFYDSRYLYILGDK